MAATLKYDGTKKPKSKQDLTPRDKLCLWLDKLQRSDEMGADDPSADGEVGTIIWKEDGIKHTCALSAFDGLLAAGEEKESRSDLYRFLCDEACPPKDFHKNLRALAAFLIQGADLAEAASVDFASEEDEEEEEEHDEDEEEEEEEDEAVDVTE